MTDSHTSQLSSADCGNVGRKKARFPLLPHECFFGLFMLATWLRLMCAVGPFDLNTVLYLILLLGNAGLIAWCLAHETPLRWHARLWFYPVAMSCLYFTMPSTVMKVTPHRLDALLQHVDAIMAGVTPSLRMQAIVHPWLTELMSLCYLLFVPYMVISWLYYQWRGLHLFRQVIMGVFTIYAFGLLGYSIVPASGPCAVMADQFTVPLTGWVLTALNDRVVAQGSNGVDVFPSLHCAIPCFLLFFDRWHARWRHRLYLVPCIGLWFSTIYLRYHYLIDVLCGFALAAFALWVVNRWAHCPPNTRNDANDPRKD